MNIVNHVNLLEDNSLFSLDVNKIRTIQTLLTASTAHCGFFVKIVFRRVLEECWISHIDKSCFLVAQLAIFSLCPVWCGSVNSNRKLITYLQSSIQNYFLISNILVQWFYWNSPFFNYILVHYYLFIHFIFWKTF